MNGTKSIRNKSSLFSSFLTLLLLFSGIATPYLIHPAKNACALASVPEALQPGEVLVYDISWSKMVSAGTAIMEIRQGTKEDGKQVLDFVLTGKSRGMVEKLYPVNNLVWSVFDPENLCSLSYKIYENVGKKKKHKSLLFDRSNNTVLVNANNQLPQTLTVPEQAQDGLASLYYLRTMKDFTIGKVFAIDVHENGKNWSIEVHTLGRERITTPAGQFNTIKVKTRPLYQGVFQNKGEAYLWLTDDRRKVPVLMKSTIKVGSFVFTLTAQKPGAPPAVQAAPKAVSLAATVGKPDGPVPGRL